MNTTPMTKPRGLDTLMEDLENAVHAADAGQARDVLAEMGPLGARVGRYLSAKGAKGLEACVSLDEQAPNLLKISPLLGPSAAITLASALDILPAEIGRQLEWHARSADDAGELEAVAAVAEAVIEHPEIGVLHDRDGTLRPIDIGRLRDWRPELANRCEAATLEAATAA